MNNEELYIFLHVYKCAGSTIYNHIENEFKKEEILFLYNKFNEEKNDPFVSKEEEAIAEINKLSDVQRSKIKVIFGINAFYGIHKYFNKKPIYLLFIRNPINRTISMYNFFRGNYENLDKDSKIYKPSKIKLKYFEKVFLEKGQIPTFEKWLNKKYDVQTLFVQMSHFLCQKKFIIKPFNKVTKKDIDAALRKFYFIGFVENYKNDSKILYKILNIKHRYPDQNISKKYYELKDLNVKSKIIEKNKLDYYLYNRALVCNKLFKIKNFYKFIDLKLDLHRLIKNVIFKPSAFLKKRSNVYSKTIHFLKKLLKIK